LEEQAKAGTPWVKGLCPCIETGRCTAFAIKLEINHNHANPKRHCLIARGFLLAASFE